MADQRFHFTRANGALGHVMITAAFGPWAKDLLRTAALTPGMRVLDVGSGLFATGGSDA